MRITFDPQNAPDPAVCAHGATADEGCPICDPEAEAYREWMDAVVAQAETVAWSDADG